MNATQTLLVDTKLSSRVLAFSFPVVLVGHWLIAAFYILLGADANWSVVLIVLMAVAGVTVFPMAIIYGQPLKERAPRLAMWMKPINLIILGCCFSPAIIILLFVDRPIFLFSITQYALLCSVLAVWMGLLAYPRVLYHLTRPIHRFISLRSLARHEPQALLWVVLWSMPLFGAFYPALALSVISSYANIFVALILFLVVFLSLYNRTILPYAPPSAKWERRSHVAREIYLWLLWGLLVFMTAITFGLATPLLLAWTVVLVYRSRRGFRKALRAVRRSGVRPHAAHSASPRVPESGTRRTVGPIMSMRQRTPFLQLGLIGFLGSAVMLATLMTVYAVVGAIQNAYDTTPIGIIYDRTTNRGPTLVVNQALSVNVLVGIDGNVDQDHEYDSQRGVVVKQTYGDYVDNRITVREELITNVPAISASLINGDLLPDINGDGYRDLVVMGTRLDEQGEREATYYLIESTGVVSFSSEAELIGTSPYISVPDYRLEDGKVVVANFNTVPPVLSITGGITFSSEGAPVGASPYVSVPDYRLEDGEAPLDHPHERFGVAYTLSEDENGNNCTELIYLGPGLLAEESVNPLKARHFPVGLGNCYEDFRG